MAKQDKNLGIMGELIFSGKYGVKKYFIDINSDTLSKQLSKRKGKYYTLNCSRLFCTSEPARKYITKQVVEIFSDFLQDISGTVMVVGLGNAFLVADSLGAAVVKNILTTHNIPAEIRQDLGDVCALIPGVSGINGFATADIVQGAVNTVHPKCVIVIDALTAKDASRLGCSFQFSNTGVSPGAGIGNFNKDISRETLGVPVVAAGVPMMIDASSFGYEQEYFVVTPKEIDIYTQNCAKILSRALNEVLHGKEYKNYM